MPIKHNLPTAHLTPTEIVHSDDGTRVVAYPDYVPPLAAQVPTETPQGIPLPPTYEASHLLLAGIGEPCFWDAEQRREEAEAEAHLIEVLEGQRIFVGSGSYIHSIPLFTPEHYETRRMTRTLMLLPTVARSVMAETNDVLDYLVSCFASRHCVVREWVFSGGFHELWKPGEDAFESGLRLQDIVRKFQCDVGRVLRDDGVIGTALIPIFRKTEVCFYQREDGAIVLSLHSHALLACRGRLASNDWFGRQTRAKKMMARRRVPGRARKCWPAYLHDVKLGGRGTRYLTKKPQKITRRDLGARHEAEKQDERHGREKALIELPHEAIAAWAVASYRTHLCESFGPMAELRSTLDGDSAHNVPARALVVQRVNKRRCDFWLKWKSVAPQKIDPKTDRFGEDANRDRTGRYVPCKEIKAPPVHPPLWARNFIWRYGLRHGPASVMSCTVHIC